MKNKYNVNYFIKKFSAIPRSKWIVGSFNKNDRCCVFGHCGVKLEGHFTTEAYALTDLFGFVLLVQINDCKSKDYPQKTPKDRILAALRKLK